MGYDRTVRLNSLLREVISDVIRNEVKNPKVSTLITVTRVAITKDLRHAKVYISIIGDEKERRSTMLALRSAKGFISVCSAQKVVMRQFPDIEFVFDDSVDKRMRVEELLKQVRPKESDNI